MIGKTIPEVFFETVERYPQKTALLYKKEGVYFPISYQEFGEKVKVMAVALQKFGVGKGDMVAILSENRPEWAISDLAAMLTGAVVVPLHTTLSPGAISNILSHCRAKVLIVSNSILLNKFLLGQLNLQFLEKVIFMQRPTAAEQEALKGRIFTWAGVFNHNREQQREEIFLEPDDACSIIYTSGTTGEPKGVMLSHENFLSNVEAVLSIIPVKKTDVFLSFLPLSHVLERLAGYYIPISVGATIAYAENIKQLPQNLKEVRPTILISVPRVFEKFHDTIWDKIRTSGLKNRFFHWALRQRKRTLRYKIGDSLIFKKIKANLGGRLRLTVSGGATLNERIARFFYKIGVMVLEGYGLTETSPVVAVNRERDFRFGTVGKPLPGTKVKISPEKEILVRGPNVTKGYFKNEEATQRSFDQDNWFHTGDMGFLDKQGFLTVIGRIKEMIVTSGGKNVWPEPIEARLNKDRFIVNSMVLGNNRRFISVLIVPDWEEVEMWLKENKLPMQEPEKLIKNPHILDVFQQRLDQKINPNLCEYERIRGFNLLVHDFSQERDELAPTLKLRRHIIEKRYQKEIDEIYVD